MKNDLFTDIMDSYYGESTLSLKEISNKHQVSLSECQTALQDLVLVSKCYQNLPQHQISQVSLNKIMAHAREQAESLGQHRSFWQVLLKPALSLSFVLLAGFVSFQVWQNNQPTKVAIKSAAPVSNENLVVKKKLFETPFDKSNVGGHYRMTSRRPYFNSLVSPVSMGGTSYSLHDDELDQRMLSKKLNVKDVETLYFRARKLEKQGYYQEALRDYQFISKNYPDFDYRQALPLGMARCLEKLGDKDTALNLLVAYEKIYGSSDDIQSWKDQLKSETF